MEDGPGRIYDGVPSSLRFGGGGQRYSGFVSTVTLSGSRKVSFEGSGFRTTTHM